jgi:hypothetical protein
MLRFPTPQKIEYKMWFEFLYRFCPQYFWCSETVSNIWSKMYVCLHVNYQLCLLLYGNLHFHDNVSKNTKISNLMKIRPVVAELFHGADGQTDGPTDRRTNMTKLTVSYPNVVNALKNQLKQPVFPVQYSEIYPLRKYVRSITAWVSVTRYVMFK